MKLGIAGPVSLHMLARHVQHGEHLPEGYKFAPMATWVEAFLSRGYQVSLFTLAPAMAQPRTFRGDRLTIHVGRYRERHRARDLFAVERADLLQAMQSDPCDLIHAHWTYEFAIAALTAGGPVLVTAHDAPLRIFRFSPNPYRAVRVWMAYQVARRAPYMTAVSPHVADHFRRVLRYGGHLDVVPNMVSPDLLLAGSQRQRPAGPLTFATILRGFDKLKNGRAALQAFAKIRALIPEARLLMFGEGYGHGEAAEEWARAQELGSGVDFAGISPYCDLINRLRNEVHVLVHPSLEESFAMAVAEAMALGVPVIAIKGSGGPDYILEGGQAGVLIDANCLQQLVSAMLRLSDAGISAKLAATARAKVEATFGADVVVAAFERQFQHILSSGYIGTTKELPCLSC